MRSATVLFLIATIAAVSAQSCQSLFSQCGGQYYTGTTCCVSGTTCTLVNQWYSQCVTATTPPSPITSPSPSPRVSPPPSPSPSPFPSSNNPVITPVNGGQSGNGKTTRYWDCCKPSCAWSSNVSGTTGSVRTCAKSGATLLNSEVKNVCAGGGQVGPEDGFSYMCTDSQPQIINDNLSYGFVASNVAGVSLPRMCCTCYELTFTSGPVSGKKMVVQVTNTGGDLGNNHFDIQMPAGGLGIFDGCSQQFNTDANQWGQRYGGVSSVSECSKLPQVLQAGCQWRFGWFKNADNPDVSFREVICPIALTSISGCKRNY